MVKKITVIIFLIILFCTGVYLAFAQTSPAAILPQVETVDINKDGTPDVTYHNDGKYVTKIEADTNYDGRPDVTIYTEDGKFKSAEADTDYDGKPDKKFNDCAEFNKWVNVNNPDFESSLNRPDWMYPIFKF